MEKKANIFSRVLSLMLVLVIVFSQGGLVVFAEEVLEAAAEQQTEENISTENYIEELEEEVIPDDDTGVTEDEEEASSETEEIIEEVTDPEEEEVIDDQQSDEEENLPVEEPSKAEDEEEKPAKQEKEAVLSQSKAAEVKEEMTSDDEEDEEEVKLTKGEEEPVLRATAIPKPESTVLCFTSDTHNKDGNVAANRLGSWLDLVSAKYGGITLMAFGGDMANANASQNAFWTLTQADMDQLDERNVTGVYTTGNHEYSPGSYTHDRNDTTKRYVEDAQGAEGSNFRIYCLGSAGSSWNAYSSAQDTTLETYLNSVGNDKVIIVITHYPLHYNANRLISGAGDIIDTLNNAAATGKKIVYLWGHNHTDSDRNYDEIFVPGSKITYGTNNAQKEIKFYYGAAGCMSDSEYGSGSASVKGKGLVLTIDSNNKLTFEYYNENLTAVTEGGTVTEKDPVAAEAISITPSSDSIMVRKTTQLKVVFTPSDATDQGITWSSSNENVATVDTNGKVRGISVGEAVITAVSVNGGVSATAHITVTENNASGTTYVLTDTIEEGGDYLIVSSKADGNAYAMRNPGATSSGATPAATQVYISGETIETEDEDIIWTAGTRLSGFELINGENAIFAGKSGNIGIYTIANDPYADRYWVYDGTYLLYKGGSYTYEIYYENGFTGRSYNSGNPSHPVYIYERTGSQVAVQSVSVSPSTLELRKGRTSTLTASVTPSGASKRVTWSSDAPGVATVDSTGKVTAVAAGTAKIYATSVADGTKSAYCTVTVTEPQPGDGTTYILTDTLEDGQEYLIANGDSGNVYILSTDAGSSRQLKGVSVEVVDGAITIEDETVEGKVVFTAEQRTNTNNGADSFWLTNSGKYLYTNNANGLRMVESSEQGSSDNTAKVWHYKADNKNLLWYFKDTSETDGYTDTSQTYKYYLSVSNGVFTDNHVSTTSLANSSTPKMYLFVRDDSTPADVTGVSLDKTALTLKVGRTATLTATVTPRNAQNKNVTWSSSKPEIATVNNGTVTALKAGTTTITVTTEQYGYTASCEVTVTEVNGKTFVLTDKIEEGGDYLIVSSNEDGRAYAMRNPGATSSGATPGATQVTISDGTIETEAEDIVWTAGTRLSGFELINNENAIFAGKGGNIGIYTIANDPYADRYWFYDGTYLLYKGGDYTYEVYYENGFTDRSFNSGDPSHPVYIYERVTAPADVNGVTLDKTSLGMRVGRTASLTATVTPKNALNKNVTWSSSKPSVATVNNGVITAIKTGTTTITVTTEQGGYTASCVVTVSEVAGSTYVLTDKLVDGQDYLIANGNSGSVYVLSTDAGSSRQLKGVSLDVDNNVITIEDEDVEAKVAFTAEKRANANNGADSFWLTNSGKYLYTNSADGLRMVESSEQGSSDNTAKVWHYKADGKYLLWYFKDTSNSDGYTDTSQTYKYYLELSNGFFTDNHVSTSSIANANTPKMYLYVKEDIIVPVHEHTYGEPAYVWSEDNSECTATATCSGCDEDTDGHTVTQTVNTESEVTVSPTCTATGTRKYTAVFTDELFTQQTKDVEIPATGHAMTHHDAVPATCTEAGNSEYWSCSNCSKYFSDAEGTTEIEENSWAIAALGHTEEVLPAVEPTCTESGLTEGKRCSLCGEIFAAQEEIPATGHKWGSWAYDAEERVYKRICENDPTHTEIRTIAVTSVKLNKTSTTITVGETETLTAIFTPAEATNINVSWSSINTDVATVDSNGKVTAVSAGETTIVAIPDEGGSLLTCAVTVVEETTVAVTGVKLNKSSISLAVGKTETLTATVSPADATNKNVTWSSSNTSVATVDSNGKVTAKGAGTATITVKTEDGGKTAKATVEVTLATMPKAKAVAVYNSANGADIRWKPIAGVRYYAIWRKRTNPVTKVLEEKIIKVIDGNTCDKDESGNYKYIDTYLKDKYTDSGKEWEGGWVYYITCMSTGDEKTAVQGPISNKLNLYRLKNPVLTKVTANGNGKVTVEWTHVTNTHAYEVQYTLDGGKTWIKVKEVEGENNLKVTVTGLPKGQKVNFRIRCRKTNANLGTTWSEYSPWKSCVVK